TGSKHSPMKITIISDIHDHVENLQKALTLEALQQTDVLLCCGDLCSPFMIKLLAQGYSRPIHTVLGNNDGDLAAFIQISRAFPHFHMHGEYFRDDVDGLTLAMNHYPEKARALAQTQKYDVVCYGHNHTLSTDEAFGHSLCINPGTLMGFHGGNLGKTPATFLILDTGTLKTAVFTL
ncbi:MAG: YfcE family phosphodiesterase, partial [Bacteroidota bacterium]